MTEEEFRIEARRIAIAFGIPADTPANNGTLPHEEVRIIYAIFKTVSFDLDVSFHEISSNWSFEIFRDQDYIESIGPPEDPSILWKGSPTKFRSIMNKALYLLGYDVESLSDVSITAHEKLEWQLEFQRRLREETSQAE